MLPCNPKVKSELRHIAIKRTIITRALNGRGRGRPQQQPSRRYVNRQKGSPRSLDLDDTRVNAIQLLPTTTKPNNVYNRSSGDTIQTPAAVSSTSHHVWKVGHGSHGEDRKEKTGVKQGLCYVHRHPTRATSNSGDASARGLFDAIDTRCFRNKI